MAGKWTGRGGKRSHQPGAGGVLSETRPAGVRVRQRDPGNRRRGHCHERGRVQRGNQKRARWRGVRGRGGRARVPASGRAGLVVPAFVFSDHFGVIVKAYYRFENGDPEEIQARIDDLTERRYAKQPMDQHSAGSTFKRPEGHFASALIDQSGLRGYAVGDAAVSEKHTGFLINKGNASAEEFCGSSRRCARKCMTTMACGLNAK